MDPKEQSAADNHSNQLNPNHSEYAGDTAADAKTTDEHARDNRSNQLNPNHPEHKGA